MLAHDVVESVEGLAHIAGIERDVDLECPAAQSNLP